MKIAYLIAAHTDPQQLRRLVLAIGGGYKNDVFIHIDKKADESPFRTVLADIPVFFVKERVRTNWGGYSQCLYQMALMRECINSGNKYERVFFLSGLDYPLWSNKRIETYLEAHPKTEFIQGMNLSQCHEPSKMQTRVCLYHYRDLPLKSAKLRRLIYGIIRETLRLLHITKRNHIVCDGEKKEVYCGSSWWCLTGECLQYVYDMMTKETSYERYFKTCLAPDELMVQTIIFNSPYAKHALLYEGNYPGLTGLTPLHYIEYTDHISVYTEKDFEKLMASGKMFVRKLQTDVSDGLIKLIEEVRK